MPGTVVVVGAGIIGVASAYSLAKAGWNVTLLDRAAYGSGCSAGNCGYICPSHALPLATPGAIWYTLKTLFYANSPLKVRPGFLLRNLGWFLSFARRCNTRDMLHAAEGIQALLNSSRSLFDDLLAEEAIACEWDTHGLLFVFQTAHAYQHYADTNRLLSDRFALPADVYDAQALTELEPALKPGSVSGGYLYRGDAQVRPDVLLKSWRAVLLKLGVRIVEDCEATGFTSTQQSATTLCTNQGEFLADAFVVATGAWTPKLNAILGCKVPIIPGKGYSYTVDRPALCPTYPMIWEEHRVAVSPFETGLRIGSTMEFAGYDETLNPSRLKLLRDAATMYLKEPGHDARLQNEWWGWRPMIHDGNPVIDRSPKYGNVWIAAGHGMLGLSMATGTGKLIAELLDGRSPHVDASAYSLKRFE